MALCNRRYVSLRLPVGQAWQTRRLRVVAIAMEISVPALLMASDARWSWRETGNRRSRRARWWLSSRASAPWQCPGRARRLGPAAGVVSPALTRGVGDPPRAGHAVRFLVQQPARELAGAAAEALAADDRFRQLSIGAQSPHRRKWPNLSASRRPSDPEPRTTTTSGTSRMPNADRLPRAVKLGDQARAHREPGAPTDACAMRPSPPLDTYGQPNFVGRLFPVTSVTPFPCTSVRPFLRASVPPLLCVAGTIPCVCFASRPRLSCCYP